MPDAYSLGGAAIQGGLGLIGTSLQYAFNKRLAAQQNQYNIDMWNMQNEYNSPQAQMQRFHEAGLNPNLIYGQGSAGNNASAPQMVTPEAPKIDRQMEELGKLFHLQNLRLLTAQADKAETEAKEAWLDYGIKGNLSGLKEAEIASLAELGQNYDFDPKTGSFVYNPKGFSYLASNNPAIKGRLLQHLANNYYRYKPLSTVSYRNAYLDALRDRVPFQNLLTTWQIKALKPQVNMLNYQSKYYPASFWIGNASRVGSTISGFLPKRVIKLQ